MHWYALSKTTGMATLCASEQDARREAKAYDNLYPQAAPHIATQLVPLDAQELIEACVPGGSICDPQVVADAIREYMTPNLGVMQPCPFCGHVPDDLRDALHPTGTGWREDNGMRHYLPRNDPRPRMGDAWEMGCLQHEGGCGATVTGDSMEEAVAAWNRRPHNV